MDNSYLLPLNRDISSIESLQAYITHLLGISKEELLKRKQVGEIFESRFEREISFETSKKLRLKAKGTSKLKINLTEEESREFGIKAIRIYDLFFSPQKKGILHVLRLTTEEIRNFDQLICAPCLPGDRIQRLSRGTFFMAPNLGHWSGDWKRPDLTAGKVYPRLFQKTLEIFPFLLQQKEDASIVEICSGKGDDAASILKLYSPSISSYMLIDKNLPSCLEAKSRLHAFPQATINNADLLTLPVDQLPSSIDILIGTGALTHLVLNEQGDAKDILKKFFPLIKSGGFILLTGLTRQFLSIDQLSTMMPLRIYNTYDSSTGSEYFVLQKDPSIPLRAKHGQVDPFFYMKEEGLPLQEALEKIGMPLQDIQEIDLSALELSSEDIDFLRRLPNVRKLALRGTSPALQIIDALPSTWADTLEELDLSYAHVGEEALASLHKNFSRLSRLSLYHNPILEAKKQVHWQILFALKNPKCIDLSFLSYSHYLCFDYSSLSEIFPMLQEHHVKKVLVPQYYLSTMQEGLKTILPDCRVVEIRNKPTSAYLFPPIQYLNPPLHIHADYYYKIHSVMKRVCLEPQLQMRYIPQSDLLFSFEVHQNGMKAIHLKGHGFAPIAIGRTKVIEKGLLYHNGKQQVIARAALSPMEHSKEIEIVQAITEQQAVQETPGLVRIYGAEMHEDELREEKCSMLMEFYPFSLQSYDQPLSRFQRWQLVDSLLKGIITLHQWGIVHGDIHMGNALLKQQEYDFLTASLCDFGLARKMGEARPNHTFHFLFSPPEILSSFLDDPQGTHVPDESTDTWMLGMLFAHLFSLVPGWFLEEQKHFDEEASIEERQKNAKRILSHFSSAPFLPTDAPAFIQKMLELDPSKRATPIEIQQLFIAHLRDILQTEAEAIELRSIGPTLALLLGSDIYDEYQKQVNAYSEEEAF